MSLAFFGTSASKVVCVTGEKGKTNIFEFIYFLHRFLQICL